MPEPNQALTPAELAARFPAGPFSWPDAPLDDEQRQSLIDSVATLPARLEAALDGLADRQLAARYREGGWTIAQVVHHLPDSHLNGFVRFKLALTEDRPTITPYDQDAWVALADVRETPIHVSLDLLAAVHRRWVSVLRSMRAEDFARTYHHPELGRDLRLDHALANYAWHGENHLAQVQAARTNRGW